MSDLIKIEERNGVQAVGARDLHYQLGNKRQFADWIKQRIEQYGFVEKKIKTMRFFAKLWITQAEEDQALYDFLKQHGILLKIERTT